MEKLQTIKNTLNKETDCPVKIDKCELRYDAENVRALVVIRFSGLSKDSKCIFDIGCYGKDGIQLSTMSNIQYPFGGVVVELSSLMTTHVDLIIRSVETGGEVWTSDEQFPQSVMSDDTMEFDSSSIADKVEQTEKRPRLTRAEKKELRIQRATEEEELREFIKNDPTEKRKRLVSRIVTLFVVVGLCCGAYFFLNYKSTADASYKRGMNLYNSGRFEEAVTEFENAQNYILLGDKKDELNWCMAMSYSRQRDFFPAAVYFKKNDGYKESDANYRSIIQAYSGVLGAGSNHTVALNTSGSVVSVGDNDKGQCDTSEWSEIIRVAAGGNHTLGITSDSKVVACGENNKKQCDTKKWRNIIAVACGSNHSVGVENTGRVVATGDNTFGQCEVNDWSGVVSVSAGNEHTVGLKIDGTVVACGNNASGACDIGEWNDIAMVAAGNGFTVGLKYNGKIVFAGNNSDDISTVKKAKDVISITAGSNHILVLHENGTVSAYGSNASNQATTNLWTNVLAIAGGDGHSVGAANDGTVYGVGNDSKKQLDLASVKEIGLPKATVTIRKGEEQ